MGSALCYREAMTQTVLAADFGGTHLRAGLVTDNGEVISHLEHDTPANATPAEIVQEVSGLLVRAAQHETLRPIAACIATAGLINAEAGMVIFAPNIPGFRNLVLTTPLAKELGIPTFIENDASAAALGEFRFGAGQRLPQPDSRHAWHRHRRRTGHRGPALPGFTGAGGRDRPHDHRSFRAALSVRLARLHGGDGERRCLRQPCADPS